MKILHIVPGLNDPANGIAVAAKMIAREQSKSTHEVEVVDTRDFVHSNIRTFEHYSEIWIHSMWLPVTLKACWKVLQLKRANHHCTPTPTTYDSSPRLVRMTHANLDPVRLGYHGWKKRLVAPVERWLFRQTDRVVVTCEAEKKWCQQWGLENEFEILDLKRFFKLGVGGRCRCTEVEDIGLDQRSRSTEEDSLHVLYLGRRHPLKGVEYLEQAVEELNQSFEHSEHSNIRTLELRIVSDHFGEELEKDWAWCDVLCLPTLSENFGLVVAEALERGKRVITTDGAPAWRPMAAAKEEGERRKEEEWRERLIYLEGFRDGTDEERVRLLEEALRGVRRRK